MFTTIAWTQEIWPWRICTNLLSMLMKALTKIIQHPALISTLTGCSQNLPLGKSLVLYLHLILTFLQILILFQVSKKENYNTTLCHGYCALCRLEKVSMGWTARSCWEWHFKWVMFLTKKFSVLYFQISYFRNRYYFIRSKEASRGHVWGHNKWSVLPEVN